ncbi:hypothetical protein GCK72_013972 [Caenorhabditis remanei]|uniref:Uncharacterized protein n=1 Tax=Caenorhabditis remanei TaxID=31234 RepID=E3M7E9_CAERE|nr:hypothetical protein GCK72_013972 [Caenorhabditis remanei]EFO92551.1 hypothetical protein CRE_20650 [Caenorhabditis remanei]EFO93597.1 hypothetical protein CRE_12718 [Caenorhabditis remanei]KAF1757516.1 hypothetical protein GCK72_013972 [Caenorhabditis remanei]
MPLFGSKKNDKKDKSNEAPSYPKQAAVPPPQVAHYPMTTTYPQGTFVQQNEQFYFTSAGHQLQSAPNATTVAFARSDLPGAYDNFCEGFLDGPDFSNRVPDRNIPPAPGSYYFYSHGAGPATSCVPPYTGSMPGPSSAPPPAPPTSSSGNLPPPPTYEQVLSQEVKEKL